MSPLLSISDLHISVEGKQVLCGVNLSIRPGEVHVLMGPNGMGKSTLARVLSGHPAYTIDRGKIQWEGEDLSEWEIEERAHKGLFTSSQAPVEVPGVKNRQFLYSCHLALCRARGEKPESEEQFEKKIREEMQKIGLGEEFWERQLNEGFSGGERKRNELLQLALFQPKCALLDEIDSGLDQDAMQTISQFLRSLYEANRSFLFITHYQHFVEMLSPHYLHILYEGKIVYSGQMEVLDILEREGFRYFASLKKPDDTL